MRSPMKFAIVLVMTAGCASHVPARWDADFDAHDGDNLEISGTPVFSEIVEAGFSLCRDTHVGAPTGSCLDVIAPAPRVAELRRTSAACVVVSGKFLAFGADAVGMGYLRSKVGLIESDRIRLCDSLGDRT